MSNSCFLLSFITFLWFIRAVCSSNFSLVSQLKGLVSWSFSRWMSEILDLNSQPSNCIERLQDGTITSTSKYSKQPGPSLTFTSLPFVAKVKRHGTCNVIRATREGEERRQRGERGSAPRTRPSCWGTSRATMVQGQREALPHMHTHTHTLTWSHTTHITFHTKADE